MDFDSYCMEINGHRIETKHKEVVPVTRNEVLKARAASPSKIKASLFMQNKRRRTTEAEVRAS